MFTEQGYEEIEMKELRFCHKLTFLILLSLQLWYFKVCLFDIKEFYSLKYQRSTISDLKNIWVRKSEFVAKSHFLSHLLSGIYKDFFIN